MVEENVPGRSIELAPAAIENPFKLTQDLMLMSVLPNHIRILEKISECLDHDDWQGAVGIGLFSTLTSMGGHMDTAAQPDHPAVQAVSGLHQEVVQASNLAARLIEDRQLPFAHSQAEGPKSAWELAVPANYTDEERKQAIRILKGTVEGLIHGLRELKE